MVEMTLWLIEMPCTVEMALWQEEMALWLFKMPCTVQ